MIPELADNQNGTSMNLSNYDYYSANQKYTHAFSFTDCKIEMLERTLVKIGKFSDFFS